VLISVASLSAGALHYLVGWQNMAKLTWVPVIIIASLIALMVISERREKAS